MSEQSQPKITIEDLLRLKRAERPSVEFWSEFETNLRTKQLAAIVEKRPWWQAVTLPSRGLRAISRWQLPMGATAVLALTLVAVRHYQPVISTGDYAAPATLELRETPAQVASVPLQGLTEQPLKTDHSNSMAGEAAPVLPGKTALIAASVPYESVSSGTNATGLMAMIPWAAPQTASVAVEAPSAETIAAKFDALASSNLTASLAAPQAHTFESRVVEEAAALPEPDVRPVMISSPRELRRARIMSTLVADNATDAERSRVGHARDVLTSGLSDDQLYDSAQRTGMGGDRFTVKF